MTRGVYLGGHRDSHLLQFFASTRFNCHFSGWKRSLIDLIGGDIKEETRVICIINDSNECAVPSDFCHFNYGHRYWQEIGSDCLDHLLLIIFYTSLKRIYREKNRSQLGKSYIHQTCTVCNIVVSSNPDEIISHANCQLSRCAMLLITGIYGITLYIRCAGVSYTVRTL